MKLQARNFVVRKPETIDITMFFKKFCIATRTTKVLKLQDFGTFSALMGRKSSVHFGRNRADYHIPCSVQRRAVISSPRAASPYHPPHIPAACAVRTSCFFYIVLPARCAFMRK